MERLKHMKEQLMCKIESQMEHLDCVNTHELGAAIDMIKDLTEACYYCSIVKAMEERSEEEKKYDGDRWSNSFYPPEYYRDMDKYSGGMRHYLPTDHPPVDLHIRSEHEHKDFSNPTELRDHREGSSPIRRKYYMESKQLHHDKKVQMEELEKYMQELSKDITEMITGASPEEVTLLKQKLTTLADKIK